MKCTLSSGRDDASKTRGEIAVLGISLLRCDCDFRKLRSERKTVTNLDEERRLRMYMYSLFTKKSFRILSRRRHGFTVATGKLKVRFRGFRKVPASARNLSRGDMDAELYSITWIGFPHLVIRERERKHSTKLRLINNGSNERNTRRSFHTEPRGWIFHGKIHLYDLLPFFSISSSPRPLGKPRKRTTALHFISVYHARAIYLPAT